MRNTIFNETLDLLKRSEEQGRPVLIAEGSFSALPEPVRRYLEYARAAGRELVRVVHFAQQGTYRTQPGKKWFPFVAEQIVTTHPVAFLWHMSSRPFPFLSVSVIDGFSNGSGNLRVKLGSLITVSNARGPEMDQGELQRYLSEMACYPTAWLSDNINWQAIDANSASATLSQQGITASVVLHVDEQGQLTHVTARRYREEHGRYQLEDWSGRFNDYREVDGMLIPTRLEATWHLASGEFTWFRSELKEIEYNQSKKVTKF